MNVMPIFQTPRRDTFDALQEHLMGNIRYIGGRPYKDTAPNIVCVNGMTVSIQAGQYLYCTPRSDTGPWETVELGFPSIAPPDAILAYADERENPTGTVYGYVPIKLVVAWIVMCGGIAPLPVEKSIPATWELDDNKNDNEKVCN